MEVRVARIFNTYGPRMHMADGKNLKDISTVRPKQSFLLSGPDSCVCDSLVAFTLNFALSTKTDRLRK